MNDIKGYLQIITKGASGWPFRNQVSNLVLVFHTPRIIESSSISKDGFFFNWKILLLVRQTGMSRISTLETEMAPDRVVRRLVALRETIGLSKSEFADRVGIDRSSYTKIEKSEKPLKIDMGYSICENFGVSLDYLYRGQTHQLPVSLALEIRERLASNHE